MKTRLFALLFALCLLCWTGAFAEDDAALPGTVEATPAPEESEEPMASEEDEALMPEAEAEAEAEADDASAPVNAEVSDVAALTTATRWFVNQYNNVRSKNVTYYDDVYAVNHGKYGLTPFSDAVPAEYFVVDEEGYYAVAPIVLDIADAMRTRLYGDDVGELGLLYGQYCDRVRGKKGRVGFSGVHEGIDFIAEPGQPLHAILDGVVTRAGDSNGTVGIYSEEYDITLLYLHCEQISVRRGDEIEAGTQIGVEGSKKSGSPYTHIELRDGRHTSSNPYRNATVESDCPYSVMLVALEVEESGREAVTYAAAQAAERERLAAEEAARMEAARIAAEAERMRLEAEAAAKAAEEERLAMEAAQAAAEATPDVELVDNLPGAADGYGFSSTTPSAQTTPVPEATLPPANS